MSDCAGLLSLQSLNVEGNNIQQELDIRTLAALPDLRHLGLARNPVIADMDFRERRAFVVDLMPGTHSSVSCAGSVNM